MDFYHATLANLDGQPLYARGAITTIHASLTYAAWYGCWLASMTPRPQDFTVYHLQGVEKYVEAHVDGGFCVREVGSFPEDDRNKAILEGAPELFRKGWDWSGELSYIPAHHLRKLDLAEVQKGIKADEWLYLSGTSNLHLQFVSRSSFLTPSSMKPKRGKLLLMGEIPAFLRPAVPKG
jgi:hypothetical protein